MQFSPYIVHFILGFRPAIRLAVSCEVLVNFFVK